MRTVAQKIADMSGEVAAAERLHGQAPRGVKLQMGWAEKALAQGNAAKAEEHWLQVFGWLRAPQGYGPAGRMPWLGSGGARPLFSSESAKSSKNRT